MGSKAIDNKILLNKLELYGVRGNALVGLVQELPH
jgi:hypothetical protein